MPLHGPDPSSWLRLHRTVRFGDTDAAGVMHFHQLLRWCHEAYEESLERFGIPLGELFPGPGKVPCIALPIVHCSADFRRPLKCGDPLAIELQPERIDPSCFEVHYRFRLREEDMARGLLRHVAIETASRVRSSLPEALTGWLEASAAAGGARPQPR
jgi:1,4-dihydroxy-2-naphthoyl-CoA hydrolase